MFYGDLLTAAAGGDSADREIHADLDDVDAAGYARTDQTILRVDPSTGDFVEQPWTLIDVSKTDVETFAVVASTDRYDCDFVIEVHYRGKHRSGKVVVVAQDGKPFRVSAVADDIPTTYINETSG
jgi:hypothetical protein